MTEREHWKSRPCAHSFRLSVHPTGLLTSLLPGDTSSERFWYFQALAFTFNISAKWEDQRISLFNRQEV